MKLHVLELLEKNGKSKFWLWKQVDMSYPNFNKMVNNKTKSIRYKTLEEMCRIFNCTPSDLIY